VQVQAKKEERELTISGSRAAPAEAKPAEGEGSDAQQQQQAGRRRRIERRFGDFSRTFKVRRLASHPLAPCVSDRTRLEPCALPAITAEMLSLLTCHRM